MRSLFFFLLLLPTIVLAQTTAPDALTTASKPKLGTPESASAGKGKGLLGGLLPESMTPTITLPTISGPKIDGKDVVPSLSDLGVEKPASVGDFFSETLPDLGLKLKQIRKEKSEKRQKTKLAKTEYEGLPMVKTYAKIGSGDRTVIEEFYILRNAQEPSRYVREVFWFDQRAGRVSSAAKDRSNALLLHGPYKRYVNGDLVEECNFYAGARDGRWEKYDANFMLLDKTRWLRGFPADSRIMYYDSAHTKIKEVVPVQYGKITGQYVAFYENGQVMEEGKYENGVKIGRWTEYHAGGTRRFRRKLTQYARDQWEPDFESYTISEWDDKGKLTYERPKEKKVATEEEEE
jgi:antitoxin component YwqK of YwqJK toxin-antitoxin module